MKLRPELYHLVTLSHVVRHLVVNPLPMWFLVERFLASCSRPAAKNLAKVI